MKKYWKVAVTTIISILAIATFYTNLAQSASSLPQFVIKKESGNGELVESIVIEGRYYQKPLSKELQITSSGSEYRGNPSLLQQLVGYHQPEIEKLIEEHRDFMRGKAEYIRSFYEDEKRLVYVNATYGTTALSPRDFKFSVSVLDKKKNKTVSFELPIPNEKKYRYIRIGDVQVINGQLKVITINGIDNGSEAHVYPIDLETKKFTDDETIISATNEKDAFAHIGFINESKPTQSQNYIVFTKLVQKGIESSENNTRITNEHHTYIAYNLETKEKTMISLPKKYRQTASVHAYSDSLLYLTSNKENELKLIPYNFKSGKIGHSITVPSPPKGGHTVFSFKGNFIYTLTPYQKKKSAAVLKVIDIKSGKTLYQGKIVEKNPSKDKNKYDLFFYEMKV